MAGSNRFYWSTKYNSRREVVAYGIKCVFISYQKNDFVAAKKIADYLLNSGVDIYFDEYDKDLKLHHQKGKPREVTKAICNGINNSSHMLVVVSPNTLYSTWVPFEIGYGYDQTDLGVLCLKGIPKGSLPEYVRAAPIVRDIYDLNRFVSQVTGKSEQILKETRMISDSSSYSHPLGNVMDSLISDQY